VQYTLRPYQEKAVDAGLSYIENNSHRPSLIVAPVGCGKSLIIANITNQVNEPVIILQPSTELLRQNYLKYTSYGNEASIFSASMGKKEIGHVTYATPKSIISQAEFIRTELKAKIVIIDEAHYHTKKESVINDFITHIGADKVIGLTATPVETRTWGGESYLAMINRSKANLFKDIIHVTQISEVKNYWTKMVYQQKYVDKSKLVLNTAGTDYTNESLREFYTFNRLKEKVTKEIEKMQGEGRRAIIVFVPSIQEAIELSNLTPGSAAIHSNMTPKERKDVLEGFLSRKLGVIFNVNILGMGFDDPELDGIITARPTNSFTVHYQQLGRGVRYSAKKQDCKVSDFSGNLAIFGELDTIRFEQDSGRWGMFLDGKQMTTGKVHDEFEPEREGLVTDPNWDGKIWFGKKYRGRRVESCPVFYLEWIKNEFQPKDLKTKALLSLVNNILDKKRPKKTFK